MNFLSRYKGLDLYGRFIVNMGLLVAVAFTTTFIILACKACVVVDPYAAIMFIISCGFHLYLACDAYYRIYSYIKNDSNQFLQQQH